MNSETCATCAYAMKTGYGDTLCACPVSDAWTDYVTPDGHCEYWEEDMHDEST